MNDPISDAEMNDPEMGDAGLNSFEARARKASVSVREQPPAEDPGRKPRKFSDPPRCKRRKIAGPRCPRKRQPNSPSS